MGFDGIMSNSSALRCQNQAKEVAMLDVLSEGRLDSGVGKGSQTTGTADLLFRTRGSLVSEVLDLFPLDTNLCHCFNPYLEMNL